MRHVIKSPSAAGFTLIEMVIAIAVGGVIFAMAGFFVRDQLRAYADVSNRTAIADTADTILRRMTRELQAALPNSVRVSGQYLEFIPVKDAGRYRAEMGGGAGDKPLDFGAAATANSFDVFGPAVTIAAGDQLVIYNLGLPGSDAYAGSNRRAATAGTGNLITSASGAFQFPLASPGRRFHVVGQPVTFHCDTAAQQIRRYTGYGFAAAQPTAFAVTAAILADGVTACNFDYTPAVLQRNGLLSINITLTRNGDSATLRHQVEVLNTP